MVINLGSVESRRARITATLFILLGAGALNLAVVESASGRMSGVVAGILIVAAVALIVVMIPVFWTAWRLSARRLIIEPTGIRWHDPKGRSWALPWHELAAVSISLDPPAETPDTTNLKRARAAVDSPGKVARLDLFPADPGVRSRHPEMEHLWEIHRRLPATAVAVRRHPPDRGGDEPPPAAPVPGPGAAPGALSTARGASGGRNGGHLLIQNAHTTAYPIDQPGPFRSTPSSAERSNRYHTSRRHGPGRSPTAATASSRSPSTACR